ncbi:MAG TPA: hypothetical protein VH640_10145 [Bryobacteraceae bacterium]|jgi:hypothetical protein
MRTTLEIDDDLVAMARDLARQRKATMGQVVSELIRKAVAPQGQARIRNGVPLFVPKRGARKPNLELVNRLREAE